MAILYDVIWTAPYHVYDRLIETTASKYLQKCLPFQNVCRTLTLLFTYRFFLHSWTFCFLFTFDFRTSPIFDKTCGVKIMRLSLSCRKYAAKIELQKYYNVNFIQMLCIWFHGQGQIQKYQFSSKYSPILCSLFPCVYNNFSLPLIFALVHHR